MSNTGYCTFLTKKTCSSSTFSVGSKPPRDVEQELMAEMDAFVLAVLAEYAKLFLRTSSEV